MANKIIEALDVPWVVLLSMDSFYKVTVSVFSVFYYCIVRETLCVGRNDQPM